MYSCIYFELDFVYTGKLVSLVYWHGMKVDLAQYHQKFDLVKYGQRKDNDVRLNRFWNYQV